MSPLGGVLSVSTLNTKLYPSFYKKETFYGLTECSFIDDSKEVEYNKEKLELRN